MLLLNTALASSPQACDAGDVEACRELYRAEAGRVTQSVGSSAPYLYAMRHHLHQACRAGDVPACRLLSSGLADEAPSSSDVPVGLDASAFVVAGEEPIPLPGGGWTWLSKDYELGESGVYVPGASSGVLVDSTVYFLGDGSECIAVSDQGATATAAPPVGLSDVPNPGLFATEAGVEQRDASGRTMKSWPVGPVRDLRIHPEGSSFAVRLGSFFYVQGVDRPVSATLPAAWPDRLPPIPPRSRPAGDVSRIVRLVDSEGSPATGVWHLGAVSDGEGMLSLHNRQDFMSHLAFVDGEPRFVEADYGQPDTLRLMETLTLELPLPRADVVFEGPDPGPRVGATAFRLRTPLHRRLWVYQGIGDGFRVEWSTATRLWSRESVEDGWTEHERSVIQVVDEDGHPLAGLPVQLDHPELGPADAATDAAGELVVWDQARLRVADHLDLTTRQEGDRLVLEGVSARSDAWRARAIDPTGAWWSDTPDGVASHYVRDQERILGLPEGLGASSGLQWIVGEDGLWFYELEAHPARRLHARRRASRDHFEGQFAPRSGSEVTVTFAPSPEREPIRLRFEGGPDEIELVWTEGQLPGAPDLLPLRFGLRAGRVDRYPDATDHPSWVARHVEVIERTFLPASLEGLRLERDTPRRVQRRTFDGNPHTQDWTYRGTERCGSKRCVRLGMVSLSGTDCVWHVEAKTLMPTRLACETSAGAVTAEYAWR